MPLVLLLVFAFVLGFGATVLVLSVVTRRQRAARPARLARLRQLGLLRTAEADPESGEGERKVPAGRRAGWAGFLAAVLRPLDRRLRSRGRHRSAEARLRRAGLKLRLAEYLVAKWGLGLLAGLAGAVAVGLPGAVGGGVAGLLVPELVLDTLGRRRLRAVARQLPDALSVVANSLRSGFSFLQAVGVAAEEMPDPIAAELRQVVRETQVDISLEDALANLLNRIPLVDLQLAVTAVLLQRQVGGNLAGLLDTVGEIVRMRWRIEADVRSLTAQGRLSGWIVGGLPFALGGFVLVVNPGYVGVLFQEPLGRFMLLTAVALQAVGVAIIRRLVRVEV